LIISHGLTAAALRQNHCLVAFSEPPSESTWLENAELGNSVWSHFPSRQVSPLGLKMLNWETVFGRIFRAAK
jgi:hypothetical protein